MTAADHEGLSLKAMLTKNVDFQMNQSATILGLKDVI